MASTVVVRAGICDPPLLKTKDARVVEVYDCNDDLVAVLHKVISEDYWAVTTVKDSDWIEALSQLGYVTSGHINKVNGKQ